MTPRENLLKTLRRQGFDQVPVDFKLCSSQIHSFRSRYGNEDYQTFFGLSHRELEIPLKINYHDGRQLFPREKLPADTLFDEYGIGHSKGSELAFHMTRMHHPLKGCRSAEEIALYPLPEVDMDKLPQFREVIDDLHSKGIAAYGFMQMTVWEASWYLRSMEELLMDIMTGDEKATLLLDRVTGFGASKARAYAECGADILSLGDDIGTQHSIMMDVGMWEEWFKPRLIRVIKAARSIKPDILIFYHSCGYVVPFIEGLISAGVDILNPVQPECMDFNKVHDLAGGRISFWGTIGTQQVLPFGTPDDVRKTVFSRLEKCGPKGGIVIGPTHLVEPEVPWENLLALFDAAGEFSHGRQG